MKKFFKKVLTKRFPHGIISLEREVRNMKTRGWYTFEDGYYAWFSGLSGEERKIEIFKHGKIVAFKPTR